MEKSHTGSMGRREFLGTAAAVLFAGAAITLAGCSEDEPAGPAGDGSVAGSIAGNHGHSVSITKAQIDAGAAVTLTFSGADHTHSVSLSAEEVALIKSGAGVHDAVSTTTNGHSHNLMFM